jgi:hypothetical protein
MFAGERPVELVMSVRQALVAGPTITGAAQCQHALVDNGAVTGRRPRLNLPRHGLARVKAEGIKVKTHTCGSSRGSVTAVAELWILTVRLSPLGAACAPDAPNARLRLLATSAAPTVQMKLARHETVGT